MMTGGLVVTHGLLGKALVTESMRIMGEAEKFVWMSTDQLSAEEITNRVREIVQKDTWIVFSDSPGTAPAVRSQLAISKGQVVITGVNLAILLSFLGNRGSFRFVDLVEKLIVDGHRSVETMWPLDVNLNHTL